MEAPTKNANQARACLLWFALSQVFMGKSLKKSELGWQT
jgi:hypothetical protein